MLKLFFSKKTYLLLFFVFSLTLSSFISKAQFTVEWGSDISSENYITKILGEDEAKIYTLSFKKEIPYLEIFDKKSLRFKKSAKITFPAVSGVKLDFEEMFLMNDNFIVFASAYNKSKKRSVSYAFIMDFEGRLDRKAIQVIDLEVKNRWNKGAFGYRASRKGNTVIAFHVGEKKKEKKQVITIHAYDGKMTLLGEVEDDYPIKDKVARIEVYNFDVDHQGNVYSTMSKQKKSGSAYLKDYYLNTYLKESNYQLNSIQLDLPSGKLINGIAFTFTDDDKMNISGFYTQKSGNLFSYNGLAGTYFMRLNLKSEEFELSETTEFEADFKLKFLTEKQLKKGKEIPAVYIPREIIKRDDGGVVLIAEYFTVVTSESNSSVPGLGSKTTTYTYGDLIVSSINPDGSADWNTKINKRQRYSHTSLGITMGTGVSLTLYADLVKNKSVYLSYMCAVKNDKIYFFYNDHPKNLETDNEEKMKWLVNPMKGVPVIVALDNVGDVERIPGLGLIDNETIMRPMISLQTQDDEIVVFASKKKINKLGRIRIEEE